MGYSGVTLYRAPNKELPDAFLDIASGQKSDCIGGAIALSGNQLQIVKLDGLELQTVKDTLVLEDYKPYGLMLHFGNEDSDNEVPEDSQQPFVPLLGADNSPLCACFIEGDRWIGYDSTNSTNSVEYFVHEYLAEKIKDLYKSVDEDLGKLVTKLRTATIVREILAGSGFGERGCISLLFANGEIVIYTRGPKHSNFTWGWASQRFGYDVDLLNATTPGQQEGAAIASAATGPKNMFGGPPPKPTVPAVPLAASPPPVIVPGSGPQPEVPQPSTVLVYMPDSVGSGSTKNKKKWGTLYLGVSHSDIAAPKGGPWALKKEYSSPEIVAKLVQSGKIVLAGKPSPAAVAAPDKPIPAEGPKPVIIGVDDRKRIDTIFAPILLGTLDTAGKYIADPSRLEEELGKSRDWRTQMGWPTKEMVEKGVPADDLNFYARFNTKEWWSQMFSVHPEATFEAIQRIVTKWVKAERALLEAAKISKAA